VSQLSWSPDGRYLAWEQSQEGSEAEGLVRVDTRTGAVTSWADAGPVGPIAFNGSQPIGIESGEPYLNEFDADGSTRPIAIAVKPEITTSYGSGFAFITSDSELNHHPVAVFRTDAQGSRVAQAGTLPPEDVTSPGMISPYEQIAASADGQWIAFEKGDHTDVCGVGPSSRLYLVNTTTRAVTSPQLPVSAGSGTVWRFETMMFSQGGILDLSAFQCGSTATNKPFQTLLLEVDHGQSRIAARDVIDGQRGPGGQLAVITGDDAFGTVGEGPGLKQVGVQQLKVDGHTVSLPATPTFISWAPENP